MTDDIVDKLRAKANPMGTIGICDLESAAAEILRLRAELKENRRLFVRDTDEYIKWAAEAKAENEKLRADLHDANEALTVAYLNGYSTASKQTQANVRKTDEN